MIADFPAYGAVPRKLLALKDGCGPIAAWGVLKYFRKRTSVARLITACRFAEDGTFAIALAVALREHELQVVFHTEPDPEPRPLEVDCYRMAEKIGVVLRPALEVDELLALVSDDRIPIVLYDTDDEVAHFSPVLGAEGEAILLPYGPREGLSRDEFALRWNAPEIYRQCIVASRR